MNGSNNTPGLYTLNEVRELGKAGNFTTWNYAAPKGEKPVQGWRLIEDQLERRELSRAAYDSGTLEQREGIVQQVAAIYQSAELFPIQYFSTAAAHRLIRACLDFDDHEKPIVTAPPDSPLMLFFDAQHSTKESRLCDFFFPNLFDASTEGNGSLRGLLASTEDLQKIVRRSYNGPKPKKPSGGTGRVITRKPHPERLTASDLRAGYFPRNFPPMVARSIVKLYLPNGGTVLDPSAGFGARMLGTLTAGKNYRYIGCDPNTETIYNLDRFGTLIEEATNTHERYALHCHGSELLELDADSIDLAFTSPPYFDRERYDGNDPNSAAQCYNKYADPKRWLDGYAAPTLARVAYALKPGSYFLVNIADTDAPGHEDAEIVDGWIARAERAGLTLTDIHYLANRARGGTHQSYRTQANFFDKRGNIKSEPILVLRKLPHIGTDPAGPLRGGLCSLRCRTSIP